MTRAWSSAAMGPWTPVVNGRDTVPLWIMDLKYNSPAHQKLERTGVRCESISDNIGWLQWYVSCAEYIQRSILVGCV